MARSNSAKTPIILEHRPAGGRGGIKAPLMQEQIDAFGMEFAEEAEQIDERSA
jgi:hypothetical protein